MEAGPTMTRTPRELIETPRLAQPGAALDLVRDVLAKVRLSGAFFVRAEFSAQWAVANPPAADMIQWFAPAATRLILFHVIAEGNCWLTYRPGCRCRGAGSKLA